MSLGKPISLLDLFPADPTARSAGAQVSAALKNYKGIVELCREAIAHFKEGIIPDPTVGENACQIRAELFADFANRKKTSEQLDDCLQKIAQIRKKLNLLPVPKKTTTSLNDLLKENQCELFLPKKVHFLTAAHILTLAREAARTFIKDENGNILVEEKTLQTLHLVKEKGFPKSVATHLEKRAKEKIAEASVKYLQKEVKKLPSTPDKERLETLVTGDHVKITQYRLPTTPCLPAVEILLKRALAKGTPLSLNIALIDSKTAQRTGTLKLFYKPDETLSVYLPLSTNELGKKSAIKLKAFSLEHSVEELREEICKKDILEIIWANFAAHPQYGGDLKTAEGPKDEKTKRFAERAHKEGLCLENPRFCRIYHLYARRLK